MFYVVFELTAIMLEHALYRPGCGITQRADSAAGNVFAQAEQQIQVFLAPAAEGRKVLIELVEVPETEKKK